jgi:extracellular matrix protein 14
MYRFGRIILLITTAIAVVVAAIPSDSRDGFTPHPAESLSLYSQSPASSPGLWVRLRDSVIEAIWGISERQDSTSTSRRLLTYNSPAPSSLRARYGDDVVLRFSIRSASEVRALVEASAILFLDVWASTGEWVDIRLAKDMVGPFIISLQNKKSSQR